MRYVIWSVIRQAWLAPKEQTYVDTVNQAGIFSAERVTAIVRAGLVAIPVSALVGSEMTIYE